MTIKPNDTWDAEQALYEFECTIDTVDKIRDGLPDDRATANALTAIHERLCGLHGQFKERLG